MKNRLLFAMTTFVCYVFAYICFSQELIRILENQRFDIYLIVGIVSILIAIIKTGFFFKYACLNDYPIIFVIVFSLILIILLSINILCIIDMFHFQ